MSKRSLIAALAAVGTVMGLGAAAEAGEWRLNPHLCPDLREDIRDSRYDYGYKDRREDRYDRRRTVCPQRAWVYEPNRREIRRGYYGRAYHAGPPRFRRIVYRHGDYYGVARGEWCRIALHQPRSRKRDRYDYGYDDRRWNDDYRDDRRRRRS